MIAALLLLVPAVWITWVLFRDRDSDQNEPGAMTHRQRDERDRHPRAGE